MGVSLRIENQLGEWIQSWEGLFRSPEDLLLDDHPLNWLFALEAVLAEWLNYPLRRATSFDPTRRGGGFKEKLVMQLRAASQVTAGTAVRPHPVIEVLNSVSPLHSAEFFAELHRPMTDAIALRSSLHDLLDDIKTRPEAILAIIEREITRTHSSSTAPIQAASYVLARSLVVLDSPRNLSQAPERKLSAVGVTSALDAGISTLATDHRLDEAWSLLQESARVSLTADLDSLVRERAPTTNTVFYADIFNLARGAIDAFAHSGQRSFEEASQDLNVAESLGRASIGSWAWRALDNAVGALGPPILSNHVPAATYYTSAIESLSSLLQSWAATLVTLAIPSGESSEMDSVILRGTEAFVRRQFRETAARVYRRGLDSNLTTSVGRELLSSLANELHLAEVVPTDKVEDISGHVLRRWAARRDVQRTVAGGLEQSLLLLAESLRAMFEDLVDSRSPRWWAEDPIGTWAQWAKDVGSATQPWPGVWRFVRWDQLPTQILHLALDNVLANYRSPHTYDVVFTVHGVDAQDQRWTTGDITWYAASQLFLGEDWPHRERDTAAESRILRAWTVTEASSAASARDRAFLPLDAALSTVTYALSAPQRVSGLRATVERMVLAAEVGAGGSTLGGEHQREEMFHVQAARDDHFQQFTKIYYPLVQRAQDPDTQPELERRLMRSFAWYREGRWESNPVTRFLKYYVALEHIFVGGRVGQNHLLPRLASVAISTWHGMYPGERAVRSPQIQLIDTLRNQTAPGSPLETALAGHPILNEWRLSIRPLLVLGAVEELERDLSAAAGNADPTFLLWSAYASSLRSFVTRSSSYDTLRSRDRVRWEFTLELLMRRRNEIAHEALVTSPDLQLYAQAMARALELTLSNLANLALNASTVKTVDAALQWFETPWLT